MKKRLHKEKFLIVFVMSVLILITCNYHFESVTQPDFVDPNSTFDVEILVSLEAENRGGLPYFGIRLPAGWIVNDSITYSGVLNGTLKYSAMMSDSMETVDSSQTGYYWWVTVGDTVDSLLDGMVSIQPQIQTDDQTGMFSLDYMLGDENNGLNFRRSDNHFISAGMPLSITVRNTNDSGDGSLRQAISEVSNGGEILFDLFYPATILLDSQLVVDRNVNITGPDTGQLIISGNDRDRVFFIQEQRSANISNLIISGGNVPDSSSGGGIYCFNSDLWLENVTITENIVPGGDGGGIYCEESNVWLNKVKIIENSATCSRPNASLGSGGNGAGIFCRNSKISFSDVTISNNSAGNIGGGILCDGESQVLFDNESRSTIYFNTAVLGNDLYHNDNTVIDVVLDTFSVLYPSSYYAYPSHHFNFDILNGKMVNADADLYVSPDGDNNNSGTSSSEPVQSVSAAITKIMADSLHPHTIYIDSGRYSPSTTGEIFPLRIPDYVTLSGSSRDSVILDAQYTSCVIQIYLDDNEWDQSPPDHFQQHNHIENLTITGGAASGLQCWESVLSLDSVTIAGNSADSLSENYGGGITCEQSLVNLRDVILRDNETEYNGGAMMINASEVDIFYSKILHNTALGYGGGVYGAHNESLDDLVMIINTIIAKNTATRGGGMACQHYHMMLTNATITENTATDYCGAVYLQDPSMIEMINGIIWENYPESIHPEGGYIMAGYSDIQGGMETGINGNIDADPVFFDTIDYYLSESSPCIDAGNADTVFNDREDKNNPGFALWPAMGTIRNDMGAYGGHGFRYGPITDIDEDDSENSRIPLQFELSQNYPNPFNPSTQITFILPKPERVTLEIFTPLGQRVATLVDKKMNSGLHHETFDASTLPSGIYFYYMQAGEFRQVKKMVLIK